MPFEKNPRKISDKAYRELVESLEQDGYHQRILVTHDLRVIGGHQRIKALKHLGYKDIIVLVPDAPVSDEQFRRILVRDNLEFGEWDLQSLGEMLPVGDLIELGLPEKLAEASDNSPPYQGLCDPDDAPEAPATPTTRPGDIWLCGDHRVICGDGTSVETVLALMAGARADLLLTDPPYNVNYEGKTKDALKIENDQMSAVGFRAFLASAFAAADHVMREGAAFYIWHADSEGFNFRVACADAGWRVRQCLIWVKNTMVMGRQDYHWKHEPCLYGWKDGAAHAWESDRKQTTVLNFDRPTRNAEHPTMKPVELMQYQLQNNTRTGQAVLDLFGGSGSTLIACEIACRKAYLCEIDPIYVDVIVQRFERFSGKQARLESSGATFAERAVA